MNRFVRWILVLPAVVAAGITGWVVMTLVWNLTRFVNIVPQEDGISLVLASVGINFIAACAAVLAGAATAPVKTTSVRVGTGVLVAALALATLVVGPEIREWTNMGLKWHILSAFGWTVGAAFGVVMAGRYGSAS